MDTPLWRPSQAQIEQTAMEAFRRYVVDRSGKTIADWRELYAYSIAHLADFWDHVWDFCAIIGDKGTVTLRDGDKMPGARFFPEGRLNLAENLLRFSLKSGQEDRDALVFWGEDKVKRRLTHRELSQKVARLAGFFKAHGLKPGDRVAAIIPNMPEAVIGALAALSQGLIWSSCSPDFGPQGILDRFGQIKPKILITADGYWYNGKSFDCLAKVAEVLPKLEDVRDILVVPYLAENPALTDPRMKNMEEIFAQRPEERPEFVQVAFDHPAYIMFSSGTTGVPKCIVHGHGGTLIQHLKEHRFHCDIRPGDRVFYFSTCGWMMWNWLVSALGSGATLLLFDGSPFAPRQTVLFDYAEAERCTLFGTSAKYIDACAKAELAPIRTHDLSSLRTLCSTGSPLAPESFDYVYRAIKADLDLASISGGTDILSCFMLGNPTGPVWRGEIQMRGLGLKVEVWDETGRAMPHGKGELVCTAPFPAMPVGFWNDPEGKKYRAAYFEKYPNIWHHGDWVELTEHEGIIVYGRSDAVLNPGGVRIGTAEIYRQVEQLDEILESIVIGQDWHEDVRVVLFVRLKPGVTLDDTLKEKIKRQIRANTTPRHVPAKIIAVADIPRTKSGKIVELAVRDVIHKRPIKNREALANPEALDLYRDLPELAT